MASLPPLEQYRALVKRLSSSNYLLNKQLQHICQVNGLRTSGVKAELQRRILDGELTPPLVSKTFEVVSKTLLPRVVASSLI